MKNKIWKSKAYKNTKVDFVKSQIKIIQLLNNNRVTDIQQSMLEGKAQIIFIKELCIENKVMKIGVKISIPDVVEKNRNQLYRALFYYLKAKFESLTFGFVEEYNEAFLKEFMPYIIVDKTGRTISDFVLEKLNKELEFKETGEQLFLEEKKE